MYIIVYQYVIVISLHMFFKTRTVQFDGSLLFTIVLYSPNFYTDRKLWS